jgi:hypothetical protein
MDTDPIFEDESHAGPAEQQSSTMKRSTSYDFILVENILAPSYFSKMQSRAFAGKGGFLSPDAFLTNIFCM